MKKSLFKWWYFIIIFLLLVAAIVFAACTSDNFNNWLNINSMQVISTLVAFLAFVITLQQLKVQQNEIAFSREPKVYIEKVYFERVDNSSEFYIRFKNYSDIPAHNLNIDLDKNSKKFLEEHYNNHKLKLLNDINKSIDSFISENADMVIVKGKKIQFINEYNNGHNLIHDSKASIYNQLIDNMEKIDKSTSYNHIHPIYNHYISPGDTVDFKFHSNNLNLLEFNKELTIVVSFAVSPSSTSKKIEYTQVISPNEAKPIKV